MRIGLAFNQKPDSSYQPVRHELAHTTDRFAEWDDATTIDAVVRALSPLGSVVRLEATRSFPQDLANANVDIVFNLAEGLNGPSRESHVPAICEFLGVPYTASDPLTLGIALHKVRSKEIFAARGIPSAAYAVVESPAELAKVALRFPVFAKPVHEGSSKGVGVESHCVSPAALAARTHALLETYEQPVLVEEFLDGQEFTVAILGTGPGARALPLVGLRFDALPDGAVPVYGFEAKWVWDRPDDPLDIFSCPADVHPTLANSVRETALVAHRALGCRDWSRVDVRCDRTGVPHVIEVNPLPGILPDPADNSCFPKAARAAGMSYDDLIRTVARLAWARYTGKRVEAACQEVA